MKRDLKAWLRGVMCAFAGCGGIAEGVGRLGIAVVMVQVVLLLTCSGTALTLETALTAFLYFIKICS